MLKAIHAQEDRKASIEKAEAVVEKLKTMKTAGRREDGRRRGPRDADLYELSAEILAQAQDVAESQARVFRKMRKSDVGVFAGDATIDTSDDAFIGRLRVARKGFQPDQFIIESTISLNFFPLSNSFVNMPKEVQPGDNNITSPDEAHDRAFSIAVRKSS